MSKLSTLIARLLQSLTTTTPKPSQTAQPTAPPPDPPAPTLDKPQDRMPPDFTLPRPWLPSQAIHTDPSLYTRQAASLLFTKLPIELRDSIWEHVLGRYTVHMFWHDRDTLRSFVCEMQCVAGKKCVSMLHGENRARELKWGSASHIEAKDLRLEKGFMPVLLSCRAVYFEAIRVLYATTRFDFTDHWPTFQYLPWTVPLSSLNHIAHISIVAHGVPLPSTPPTADFVAWIKLWGTLSLCKSLRCLDVELVPLHRSSRNRVGKTPTRDELRGAAGELLFPMQQMRGLLVGGREGMGRRRWVLKVPFEVYAGAGVVVDELESLGWRVEGVS